MSVELMELLTEIKQEPDQLQELCRSSVNVKVEPDLDYGSTVNNATVHMTRSKTKSSSTNDRNTRYTITENLLTDGKVIDSAATSSEQVGIPDSESEPIIKYNTRTVSTTNRRHASTKTSQCNSTIKQILENKILKNMSNGGPMLSPASATSSEPVHITSIQPVHTTCTEVLETPTYEPVSIANAEANSVTTDKSAAYSVLKSVLNNGPVVINTGIFQQPQLSKLKLPIPRLNPPPSNKTSKEKKTTDDSETSKDFSCGVCGKMFRHASNIRSHMLLHTGQKPYACSTCGKAFSDESNRRRHELTHQVQDRPFECKICNKTYSRSHHLDRHMQTHNEDRPFACEVCDKTFKFRSHLFEHNKIHTGEKTLSCDFCHLSFSRKYQLQVHRRTHTGEKPHKCILCGRSFSIGSALKSHMCLHTGEKFYKCVCGKAYSRKGHLQKHVQVAHTNNETGQMYCVVCLESYDQGLDLIKHMQESHKDIVNSENKSSDDLIATNLFKILKSNSGLLKNENNYENVTKIITERLGFTQDQIEFSKIKEIIKRKMDTDSGMQQGNVFENDKHDNGDDAGVSGTSDEDPETVDENLTDSNMSGDNNEDQTGNVQENSHTGNVQESSENCLNENDEESSMDQESMGIRIKKEVSVTENSCREYVDQGSNNMDSTSKPSVEIRDVNLKEMLNQMEKKWVFINYSEQDMENGKLFDLDPEEEYEDLASMGPHVCRLCGMRFTNWEFMQEHLYAHIDKLERFISRAKSKHKDIANMKNDADEEEKRFVCGICGMGFLTQARLNKHLRKHTGEKRVKCDICDKKLVDSHALRKHQRVHTGEKPYSCDICGKKFAQSSNLHTHTRVHHSGSVK